MNSKTTDRMNKILPRIISDTFLRGSGIGNEIAFYIFDYPPEDEIQVRSQIVSILEHIPRHKPDLIVKHINLFDFILEYLENRGLLEKSIIMQRERGSEALRKALSGPLHENKLMEAFSKTLGSKKNDLVLVSGIGSAWPLIRSHALLNNLHALMEGTPLVMFYPGRYDGQSLRLFDKIKNANYYRAFKLIP
jgi:hypothetical protein